MSGSHMEITFQAVFIPPLPVQNFEAAIHAGREYRRSGEFLPRSDFHSGSESFFKNPGKVVFGSESCEEQGLRIESEVEVALLHDSEKNAILVTHGSAMTSYIVRHWQVDPFDL